MPQSPAESPPAKIAHGTATIAGLAGSVAAIIPVLVAALTDERLNPATRDLLLKIGGALLGLVIIGRMAQAIATELTRGRTGGITLIGEADELEAPGMADELEELRGLVKALRANAVLASSSTANVTYSGAPGLRVIGQDPPVATRLRETIGNTEGIPRHGDDQHRPPLERVDLPETDPLLEEAVSLETDTPYSYADSDDDPARWEGEDTVLRDHAAGNPEEG